MPRTTFVLLALCPWLAIACRAPDIQKPTTLADAPAPLPIHEIPEALNALQDRPGGLDAFLELATLECLVLRTELLAQRRLPAMLVRNSVRAMHYAREIPKSEGVPPDFVDWIEGHEFPISGQQAFGVFTGRWYGRWDGKDVDHHWSDVVELDPPRLVKSDENEAYLRAYQFAWVGDGYGVNLVASVGPEETAERFILGYVIHVRDGDLDQEIVRRPHVAVPDTRNGAIVWITAKEVFYEQIGGDDMSWYGIDGYRYRTEFPAPGEGRLIPDGGFRAVYDRSPTDRVPWKSFPTTWRVQLNIDPE